MKNQFSKAIRGLFFLGIGLFFIWIFFHYLTPKQKDDIYASFLEARYFWLFLSMIVGIFSHFLRAYRWKLFLKPMGYNPRMCNVTMAVFIGYLANLALPRLGEVSRCGVLSKYEDIPFQKSFGTVIIERIIDMLSLIVLFIITIAINFERFYSYSVERIWTPLLNKVAVFSFLYIWIILGSLALVAFLFWLFLFRKKKKTQFLGKVYGFISGFMEGMQSLMKIKTPWKFIFYTLLIWFCYWLMAYLAFRSFDATSDLSVNAGLVVLIFGSIAVVLVQGGIGIYPIILSETLMLFGVPMAVGYAYGWLLWSAQQLIVAVIGGVSFFLLPMLNEKKLSK